MPRWAASNLPIFFSTAPVNAPRSWPNSSLSRMLSANAAQLTQTNGPLRRALAKCTARATNSLPTPLSPRINTVAFEGAARADSSMIRVIAGLLPTISLSHSQPLAKLDILVANLAQVSTSSCRRCKFCNATATVSATASVNSKSSGSGFRSGFVEYKWISPYQRPGAANRGANHAGGVNSPLLSRLLTELSPMMFRDSTASPSRSTVAARNSDTR